MSDIMCNFSERFSKITLKFSFYQSTNFQNNNDSFRVQFFILSVFPFEKLAGLSKHFLKNIFIIRVEFVEPSLMTSI